MSMYQPGIPTGSVPLDQDYLNLQNNFQQLDTSFSVDHTPFSVNTLTQPAGYHTNVHMIPFSTTITNPTTNYPPIQPATTAGYGQLWSAQVNDSNATDEALYFLTGGGRNLQLTSNFVPQVTTNGFTFLPGGLIFQWGIVTPIVNNTTGTTVLFTTGNMNFPTACFNIVATLIAKSSGTGSVDSISIVNTSVSKTGFKYNYTGGSSNVAFYWTAIGN